MFADATSCLLYSLDFKREIERVLQRPTRHGNGGRRALQGLRTAIAVGVPCEGCTCVSHQHKGVDHCTIKRTALVLVPTQALHMYCLGLEMTCHVVSP